MTKNVLWVFIFFVVLTGTVFSQNYNQNYAVDAFNTVKVSNTFDVFKFQNRDNPDSIKNLYRIPSPLSISSTGAFFINASIGLGIGSYAQGDTLGGTIGLLGELSGLGIMIGGVLMTDPSSTNNVLPLGMVIGGAVIFLGTRIFEYIRPWFFE